ncbi:MAG: hypothetical protein ACM3PD_04285 [Chloroflexota bacterium]|jgi:predicted nuclease with TOPRIM domain
MSDQMKFDVAMAQLEAGKFSFQMVESIKERLDGLEKEMEALRASHADAINEIRRQEYANFRLEAEARKLNGRIYALMKANAFSELFCRESAVLAAKLGEYMSLSADIARKALEWAVEEVKAGKPQAEVAKASAAVLAFAREHAPTEQQISEFMAQMGPYLEAGKKRVGPAIEKVTAYVSNLKRNFA